MLRIELAGKYEQPPLWERIAPSNVIAMRTAALLGFLASRAKPGPAPARIASGSGIDGREAGR